MRQYGSIQTKFWSSTDIYHVSDQAKLLALYLLCSPHSNMLGCFRLPIAYVAEDLNWDCETATRAINELANLNFLTYETSCSWVQITNFLKYHPIENPNQGKSIAKLYNEVPKNLSFVPQLINNLLEQRQYLSEKFIQILETVMKPFPNQEQDQEQDQKQEQELSMSGKPDVVSFDEYLINKDEIASTQINNNDLKSQALEVLLFLNEKTGKAYRPVDSNLKLIIARLKTGATVLDCRQVIAKKTREWKGNAKMAEYLRPATLFNDTKFEQYMGELIIPPEEIANDSN